MNLVATMLSVVLITPAVQAQTKSIDLIVMLQMLAGANVEQQLRRMPKWLEEKFHIRPLCDQSWSRGISDAECLEGMRSLARAFVSEEMPQPPEVITVEISRPRTWKTIAASARIAAMTIPFTAFPNEIGRFFKTELSRRNYLRRISTIERIEQNKAELEKITGKVFEIDDVLSNDQASDGLFKLLLVAREDASIFIGPSELIRLSDQFSYPYEANLKLKEDLNATANLEQIQNFLHDRARLSGWWINKPDWPNRFFFERSLLTKAKQTLLSAASVKDIECHGAGSLLQSACLLTIAKLAKFLKIPSMRIPAIDLVLIVDTNDMPLKMDYYREDATHRSVLLVRNDFSAQNLIEFCVERGWAR